jgi:hypothetical protein
MERYSLIDLLEEEEKDEDLDDVEIEIRKKRRLADSILNFITNKELDNQQEEDILASLFESPSSVQTEEIELLSDKVEPEEVARVVVETRINDLTKELDNSINQEERQVQFEKIQALQEIRRYFVLENKDIEIVSSEEVEIEEFAVIDEVKETQTPEVISDFVRPKQTTERIIKREQPAIKPHLFESRHIRRPISPIRHESGAKLLKHEQVPSQPTKSLAATRELLNKLYEKPAIQTNHHEISRPVNPLLPKEQQRSYVEKNIPDIKAVKEMLQKNNFDLVAQQRIISEILAGGDIETAIEKQLKTNEKTLGQTSSFLHHRSEPKHVTPKIPEKELPKTKADLVKTPKKSISSNPGLWAILIVIIILLGIIFRVI